MNDKTNCGPQSEITFLGMPCNLKISSLKIFATPWEVILVDTRNSQIIFEKWSTMTIIVFFPFDSGNGPIKSTKIISHGASGTVFRFNGVFFPKVSLALIATFDVSGYVLFHCGPVVLGFD